jgi:hypothetical protein
MADSEPLIILIKLIPLINIMVIINIRIISGSGEDLITIADCTDETNFTDFSIV